MSEKENVDSIVQNFVENDLASLDRIGDQHSSYELPSFLAESTKPAQGNEIDIAKRGPPLAAKSDGVESPTEKNSEAQGSDGDTHRKNAPQQGQTDQPPTAAKQTEQSSYKDEETSKDTKSEEQTPVPPAHTQNKQPRSRHVSTSSTVSTSSEKDKRKSFGNKFKEFGRRITSGSKK